MLLCGLPDYVEDIVQVNRGDTHVAYIPGSESHFHADENGLYIKNSAFSSRINTNIKTDVSLDVSINLNG